jgi:hypothetical protein
VVTSEPATQNKAPQTIFNGNTLLKVALENGTIWGHYENETGTIVEGDFVLYEDSTMNLFDWIWANTNMYYSDGSVYLAASDPIPVPTYDPDALLQGHLVGCRLRAMRGKKKPVAFLYNGVRLPKLPETDLPYAAMYFASDRTGYHVCLSSSPWEYSATGDIFRSQVYPVSGSWWKCGGDFSTWERYGGFNNTNIGAANFGGLGADAWYWTNADIPTTDGSPFLAASEPVPVYA